MFSNLLVLDYYFISTMSVLLNISLYSNSNNIPPTLSALKDIMKNENSTKTTSA